MPACPEISVVIPAFNAEKYIAATIESVLSQDFKNFEIVVVDDGSSDSTAQICKSFTDPRIRYLSKSNSGVIDSIEVGVNSSQAEIIARIDADDLMLPLRLKAQYQALSDDPNLVLVGSQILIIDETGVPVGRRSYPLTHPDIARALPSYNPFAHPAVCFRKDAYRRVGGLSDTVRDAEDYELWARMAMIGRVANLSDTLTAYRIHGHSIKSTRTLRQLEATLEVKRKLRGKYAIRFAFRDRLRFGAEFLARLLPTSLILYLFALKTFKRLK